MKYPCPVCGYYMEDPPRDYNICPSCGTEFGYHDAGRTHEELRNIWIKSGAEWWSPVDRKPERWNAYIQLLRAGLNVEVTASLSEDHSSSRKFPFTHEDLQTKKSEPNWGYSIRVPLQDAYA